MADNRNFKKVDKIASDNKVVELASLETGNKVPQAIDVEENILGAMMLDEDSVIEIMSSLTEEQFYKPEHRQIFRAIKDLNNKKQPVDIVTVSERLRQNGDFDAIGGTAYLGALTSRIGSAAHVDFYTKILIDKYIQRSLIKISNLTLKKSYDDTEPVDELLNSVQQSLFELSERNMTTREQKVGQIIKVKLKQLEDIQNDPNANVGINTGFYDLDVITAGLHPSNLVIVAGRPGMGKTAFVVTMARNMAVKFKTPVAFFSLEQSSIELVERLLIAESGINPKKIKGSDRDMSDSEWMQLNDRIAALADAPIYIDETPGLSISDFRAKARRLVTAGVKAIIIDYLQLMTGSKELRGVREQEVAEISRSLKGVAKELGVPVIALAQLNRAAADQSREGITRRPQLTQLRESGAIEQDADIVLFIHRPEYYILGDNAPAPEVEGLSEIVIAKHRNGESNTSVYLKYIKNQMRFVDLTPEEKYRVLSKHKGGFQRQQFESKMNSGIENDSSSQGNYMSLSQMRQNNDGLSFDVNPDFYPPQQDEDPYSPE